MPSEIPTTPSDRRTEPRSNSSGWVNLRPEGFTTSSVAGQVMDISSSGFRARHTFLTLTSGQIVEFTYGSVEGRARVVWTRILSGHVESGFLILPAGKS